MSDASSQARKPRDRDTISGPRLTGAAGIAVGPSRERAAMSDNGLRSAFEHAPTGMSVIALDGRWLRINDAYCDLLGYGPAELLGTSYADVTHHDDVIADREFVGDALAGGRDIFEREKRYICKDGSILWALARVELIHGGDGTPLYFVSHVQDLSGRRATLGLLHGSQQMLQSVIDNTPNLMSVTDRDHRYRLVNRAFETAFGVTSDWIIGRRDTEVLPPETIATERAQKLIVLNGGHAEQDEQTVAHDGGEHVWLLTRFALRDEDGVIDAVCNVRTDITERREEERSKRERLQCSELIYSSVAQHRLVLHGQPIVSLHSSERVATELLIRMRKTEHSDELLPPAAFLPAAERFDLIGVIDQWVADHAIQLAAAGHQVTVNLSAKTVSDSAQIDQIIAAVLANKGAAKNLIFEITETAVADNLDAARTFAIRMRKLGCAIALDDFGVGHGTFTYLKRLPIDFLKIDREFVSVLLSDAESRQVVEAIVGVAQQFEIHTIAEGVEDQATLDELRGMGIDHAQGYWTGRPAPLPQSWKTTG